jgi:hypothetical protein
VRDSQRKLYEQCHPFNINEGNNQVPGDRHSTLRTISLLSLTPPHSHAVGMVFGVDELDEPHLHRTPRSGKGGGHCARPRGLSSGSL